MSALHLKLPSSWLWLVQCCIIGLFLAGCSKEPMYQEEGYVFGTMVEVTIYGETEARARPASAQVMHEFQRLHNMLHAWKPSELSDLNKAIAEGRDLVVSPELASILQDAAALSQKSHGLFNPAIGGLVGLWGFHSDTFKPSEPDPKVIAAWVKANPQMSDLSYTPVAGGVKVHSSNRAVQIDLGGYAKGYALDRAEKLLKEAGIRNALVNIGGNIIALGRHGQKLWRVGVQHPRDAGALAVVDLQDGEAIGTSGDYQRYFMLGGKRYCHLIDPGSGYPVQGVEAVTVLTQGARAGVLSDADSKPLFVAGVQKWREAAKWMDLTDAMLVDGNGGVHITSGLRKRLEFSDKNLRLQVE